jgi:hypothetical protein
MAGHILLIIVHLLIPKTNSQSYSFTIHLIKIILERPSEFSYTTLRYTPLSLLNGAIAIKFMQPLESLCNSIRNDN